MIKIEVKGHIDESWRGWFNEMIITYNEGNSIITGNIKDECGLHGILNKIRDLNVKLISVIASDENNKNNTKEK